MVALDDDLVGVVGAPIDRALGEDRIVEQRDPLIDERVLVMMVEARRWRSRMTSQEVAGLLSPPFLSACTPRHGWLEITEDGGELRPTDRGWQRVTGYPADSGGGARLAMWADQRDKYVLRLDLGTIQRWVSCERLQALLHAAGSLNALIRLGPT